MTWAELREAVATLENNNAKPLDDGFFHAIVHPHTKHDIFGDSDFLSNFRNAGPRDQTNPLVTGDIGDSLGVRFHLSSNARLQTSLGLSGADIYHTLIMGKEYYGITEFSAHTLRSYIKGPGSAGTSDPLDQVSTVGWKTSLASARLNEAFAVNIKHTSSLGNEGT